MCTIKQQKLNQCVGFARQMYLHYMMIGANDFIFIGLKNLVDSFTNFRGKLRDQNIKVLLLAVTSFRHKQPYYAEKVRRCHNHGKRQFWFYKQFRVLREAAKKKRFFFGISFPNLFSHPPTPGFL